MKQMDQINLMLVKFDRRYIQIALIVLVLSLFILGAGAPGDFGDHKAMLIAP